MNPDTEVAFEFVPVIRQYKSGRVERLAPVHPVPPSVDAAATGVTSKDVTIDAATGLWARLYLPNLSSHPSSCAAAGDGEGAQQRRLPIVLYFHGGGLVVGTAADAPEHAFLNRLAARAGALAVSVEYRLAPEHPVPACYDDAWAALLWATSAGADPWLRDYGDAARVFVVGFSAGGNVAHNLTLRAGTEPGGARRVEGMALVHPLLPVAVVRHGGGGGGGLGAEEAGRAVGVRVRRQDDGVRRPARGPDGGGRAEPEAARVRQGARVRRGGRAGGRGRGVPHRAAGERVGGGRCRAAGLQARRP
ncbi:unnamed protein product [Urochloa humidicola]